MKEIWIVVGVAVLLMSSIAFSQNAMTSSPSSSATTTTSPSATVEPEYVIGPDDVLHIAVWKEPDLSATLPVRPDGMISLPLLNDVQASGATPMQLAASLTEKLKKYIADPRVTVVVTQINSKRIYLVGEVGHTGAIPMLPNMTVLQALSNAGLSQFANPKKIYVLRSESGKQQKLPVNYNRLLKGQDMSHNYVLKPGDTIVVP
jgi:polysaccharide biosynthesis/export protein